MGKGRTEIRSLQRKHCPDSRVGDAVRTSLEAIAQKAASSPHYRFCDLYRLINEEMLLECWRALNQDAASGVDEGTAAEYAIHLEENIRELVERLKRGSYHAKPVRRCYIPKGNGGERPLGIPALEDKLVQMAAKRILEAIFEQDFYRCSYGYRPHVGALEASDKMVLNLQFGKYAYVVEADIAGYFDSIDHEQLLEMLSERINDGRFLGLIEKWLKAGILEIDGQVLHPVTGTPQGGVISPVLANVYLHKVLDEWFLQVVRPYCHGEAFLIRYADDFVCAFQYAQDAQRFYRVLGKRLGKYGLRLSPSKTRILPFSAQGKDTRFDFLGFEFFWGKDRAGRAHVKRRTSRGRLRKSLKSLSQWCKAHRHVPLRLFFQRLNAKLRGYYAYFGVSGNFESLKEFYVHALTLVKKWLNRRSQRRSYNWTGFKELLRHFQVVRPRLRQRTRRTQSRRSQGVVATA